MVGAKVALRPKNEAPRKTWQGQRGTANFINNSDYLTSTTVLRLQQLSAACGVHGARAELLSGLIWGEAA